MSKGVNSAREKMKKILLSKDKDIGPVQTLFGALYERLLIVQFKRQKHTKKVYGKYRYLGKPRVKLGGGKGKISLDFCLEDSNGKKIIFEAKCWPGYRDYKKITKENIERFLDEIKFTDYISDEKAEWFYEYEKDNLIKEKKLERPYFGILVFDFEEKDKKAIINALQKKNERFMYILSIISELSLLSYWEATPEDDEKWLKNIRKRCNDMFGLFIKNR